MCEEVCVVLGGTGCPSSEVEYLEHRVWCGMFRKEELMSDRHEAEVNDGVADPSTDQRLLPCIEGAEDQSAHADGSTEQKTPSEREKLSGDHDVMGRESGSCQEMCRDRFDQAPQVSVNEPTPVVLFQEGMEQGKEDGKEPVIAQKAKLTGFGTDCIGTPFHDVAHRGLHQAQREARHHDPRDHAERDGSEVSSLRQVEPRQPPFEDEPDSE